jgi:hypothetical protein
LGYWASAAADYSAGLRDFDKRGRQQTLASTDSASPPKPASSPEGNREDKGGVGGVSVPPEGNREAPASPGPLSFTYSRTPIDYDEFDVEPLLIVMLEVSLVQALVTSKCPELLLWYFTIHEKVVPDVG